MGAPRGVKRRERDREKERDEVARTPREGARETMIDMSSLSNNHQFPEFTVAEYSTNFHSRFKGST